MIEIEIPIWMLAVFAGLVPFIFYVLGVIMCYKSTPRIGEIFVVKDDEVSEPYLFLELSKPLSELGEDIQDGKEVLAKIRDTRENHPVK